jgi:hypothetical protein
VNKPRWTSKQDSILRFEWGSDAAKLAAKLGRTVPAIRFRAQVLGLHLGHASGREYITTAARRTGYSVAQLRKILVAVKVRIYSSPMGVDKRTHSVDYDDVDRAVEVLARGIEGVASGPVPGCGRMARGGGRLEYRREIRLVPSMPNTLEQEQQEFQKQIPSLLGDHADEFVLFKDGAPVAFFHDFGSAYAAGIEKFGPDQDFLIAQVKVSVPTPISLAWAAGVMFG